MVRSLSVSTVRGKSASSLIRQILVNGSSLKVMVDTGACVNVIPKYLIKFPIRLKETQLRLHTWTGEELALAGSFEAQVKSGEVVTSTTFFVTEKGTQALISYELARELKFIGEVASIKQSHESGWKAAASATPVVQSRGRGGSVPGKGSPLENPHEPIDRQQPKADVGRRKNPLPADIQHLLEKAFQGEAKIRMEPCQIEVFPQARPVKIPVRRVPIAYQEELKGELDRMEKDGIVEKISTAVEWCSPIVIAHRKNGAIRVCIDYRRLNEVIRCPSRQIPTVEEVLGRVGQATCFSTLDMRNGYWQVEVEEESKKLLVFGTPYGTYTWRRLPFGLTSAPMIFQDYVMRVIGDVPNVIVYLDDIMIATQTREQHQSLLKLVLERLVSAGVALNRDKCAIMREEVTFLGYKWSQQGISVEDDPVAKLLSMNPPQSKEECRSFLGLASYLGTTNVPHYSSLADPLWKQCSQEKWNWDDKTNADWHRLRNSIKSMKVRALFDPKEKVVVQSDASPNGLGAVLIQSGKPVLFASRKLTSAEKNYSQI